MKRLGNADIASVFVVMYSLHFLFSVEREIEIHSIVCTGW